jgi:hypothetical protein
VVADRRLYDDKRARKAALAAGAIPPAPDLPSVDEDHDSDEGSSSSISSPAARAVAQAAMIEPAVESVVVEVEPDEHATDPETRRVVDAARRAIEDARRRAEAALES